jgi:hypothetical protein
MHAISSAVLDPKGKFWLGQSADNQVGGSMIPVAEAGEQRVNLLSMPQE